MNKVLFAFTILLVRTFVQLSAEMKYNPSTYRYYSIPLKGINQTEYHDLVWQCKDIMQQSDNEFQAHCAIYAGYGYDSYMRNYDGGKSKVDQFLQRLTTPTAVRLLNDLKELNYKFAF